MNKENTLSILIVSYNSTDFIDISLYALKKLTYHKYKVYIIDNNSNYKNYQKLKSIIKKYPNVHLERNETNLKGSMAHGTALNELVKYVDTPYFSILDADAIWLKKEWDKILINKLKGNVKAIGTKAPLPKSQIFPLMFAILFETNTFKNLNIDFRPKDTNLSKDTGHELSDKYLRRGLRGMNLYIKNTRDYKEGYFGKLIGIEEYYLDANLKQLIASHFGRGSTLGANKYTRLGVMKYIYQIPLLGDFLLKLKGNCEKQKWIKICKKIIDEQI